MRRAWTLWMLICAIGPAWSQPGAPVSRTDAPTAHVAAATDLDALRDYDVLMALSAHHPNERYRLYGQVAAARGDWSRAAKNFMIAASHADKYSQHRLSLLHWHGQGVPRDRVLAYVWADLAAERGYRDMLVARERMWHALGEAERREVAARGEPMLAEYGDAVAKERFRRALLDGTRRSRAYLVGPPAVLPPPGTGMNTDLRVLQAMRLAYAPSRIDPATYWREEDRLRGRSARVTVGDIEAGED